MGKQMTAKKKLDKDTMRGYIVMSGTFGMVIGLVLGGYFMSQTSSLNHAKVFTYDNRKVIRTYDTRREDEVFIYDADFPNRGIFMDSKKYLDSIEDEKDRTIEKAKIEKIVGEW